MQNYIFDLNFKQLLCPNQMRIKIAVAAPTPTTIKRRHRVINLSYIRTPWKQKERPHLLPVIGPHGELDGYYAVNEMNSKQNALMLLEFLRMTRDQYELPDYDAMCLLSFFKNNFLEARRHLYNDGMCPKMLLDIDVPWRLQVKSISELTNMDHYAHHTILRRLQRLFSVNLRVETNVLPQKSLVHQFAGRYFRLQRIYHSEHLIMVGCVLPYNERPFEVASMLIPSSMLRELNSCIEMMSQLEVYMAPIIHVSKVWSEDDQKRTKYISFDARVFEEGFFNNRSRMF